METITEVVRSSKQIKIEGFSLTSVMSDGEVLTSKAWNVCGYKWEVHVLPNKYFQVSGNCIALNLYFRGEMPGDISNVKATFGYRLIDPTANLRPYRGQSVSQQFKRSGDCCYGGAFMRRSNLETSGYLKDDAFIVECTVAVLKELDKNDATTHRPADDLVPSSGLYHHLGELLQKGTGSDVTLVAGGESFAAHKAILTSRSPVSMAEFFGHMKEKRSPCVEIKDMDAAILGAMLRFIYTDAVPELDRPPAPGPEDGDGGVGAMHMAQHLLAAADRYGIDRLKLVCEDRLCDGVGVDTAATTLALAEQHGCRLLRARCVELVAANLETVMATEGYKHLTASCGPSVMDDLMAVHGRKN